MAENNQRQFDFREISIACMTPLAGGTILQFPPDRDHVTRAPLAFHFCIYFPKLRGSEPRKLQLSTS